MVQYKIYNAILELKNAILQYISFKKFTCTNKEFSILDLTLFLMFQK